MMDCPITGCCTKLQGKQVMCTGHWMMLAKDIRQDIWQAMQQGCDQGLVERMQEKAIATVAIAATGSFLGETMTHWMEGDWPNEDPVFADVL